jgi:hypothetical protein
MFNSSQIPTMGWTKLTNDLFDKIVIEIETKEDPTFFLVDNLGCKYVGFPFVDGDMKAFHLGGSNGWKLKFEKVNLIWLGDFPTRGK